MAGIKPLLYASCDLKYFVEHGLAFYASAIDHNNDVAISILPTIDDDNIDAAFALKEFRDKYPDAKLDIVDGVHDVNPEENPKAYYACSRFLQLPKIHTKHPYILTLDIDSIVLDEIVIDDHYDLGLYLRLNNQTGANEYERKGMKIAAGAVYTTPKSIEFVMNLRDRIVEEKMKWFVDQVCLYEEYLNVREELNILDVSQTNLIGWDVENPQKILTGKGQRKFSVPYLRKKDEYTY